MPQLKPYTVTISSAELVGYNLTGEALAHSESEVEDLAFKLDIESIWFDTYGASLEQWQEDEDEETTVSMTINEVRAEDLTDLKPENITAPTLIFESETVSL